MTIIELIKLIPENRKLTFRKKKDGMSIWCGNKGLWLTNEFVIDLKTKEQFVIVNDRVKKLLIENGKRKPDTKNKIRYYLGFLKRGLQSSNKVIEMKKS